MTDDTIKQFWMKYKDADYFERRDQLKTLPFFKDITKLLEAVEGVQTTEVLKKKACTVEQLSYIILAQFQAYIDDVFEVTSSDEQ